jgi:hypothetical protein
MIFVDILSRINLRVNSGDEMRRSILHIPGADWIPSV